MAGSGFAVTNLINMAYLAESTPGTTPASPLQLFNAKSQSLDANMTYVSSQAYRADRQVPDQILVDSNPSGDVGVELCYGAFDPLLAGVLEDTWHQIAAFSTVSTTNPSTFNVASGGASVKAGHLVWSSGFTNAANNGVFKAASSTGTTVVVTAASLVTEGSSATKLLSVVGFEGASADITATSTGLASTLLDFTTLGLTVGQWVKIGGTAAGTKFATAVLNDFARITAITTNAITLDNRPAGWTTDAGTGKTIRVLTTDYLRNGTTQNSFTVERQHIDVASYFTFRGMYIDKSVLNLAPGSLIDANLSWKGLSFSRTGTSAGTGGALTAISNPIFNAANRVLRVSIGNGIATARTKKISFSKMNNMRDQKAVSTLGNVGIGNGQFNATGDFEAYLDSGQGAAVYDAYVSGAASAISTILQDSNGASYVFEECAGRFTTCKVNAGTLNSDVSLQLTLSTMIDGLSVGASGVTGSMFQLSRMPASGA